MFRLIIFAVLIFNVCDGKREVRTRTVELEEGAVVGEKYWNGEFYEFLGVPYATAPTGRDIFKAPLPVKKREGVLTASDKNIICQQVFYTGEEEEEIYMSGQEDCLVANILVPEIASEDNLLPVVVYIHSGAFAGGSSTMGNLNFLARHDVIAISINYRVGAIGFACLHTEEIPGNAALKDQLAALKWINKNIKKFGGDPNKVTLAGYSVGAAMAEMQAISKHTDGLIDKLILESGSALAPFAINRHPVTTARNIAISIGFKDTGNIDDLNEFYLNAAEKYKELAAASLNFFLTNSTFGFAPCIESTENNPEPFLTESPIDVLKSKDIKKISILTGFSNMEGLSRTAKFGEWREMMNEDFTQFIPADLSFNSEEVKKKVADDVKKFYFKDEIVGRDNAQTYVDYFSDVMFKNPILNSVRLHAEITPRPIYFYEFSYVGQLNMKHHLMDKIQGASHRDQTAYILDFYGYTKSLKDLDVRDRMTWMWTDFIKYGDPVSYESSLISTKWQKYSNAKPRYLSIGSRIEMKKNIFTDNYKFWDELYEKYYWNPTLVK
uniref:Venom carboxylesterase-6-like protein n=1 Tax=Glyphodes pyloalis TaxID=1242752 RepID=A0A7L9QHK4_GLYPY|nr:venom carboxylesterase-6-like protein [Glyphodes pyloalis]